MQAGYDPPKSGNVSFRYGLLIGVILVAIESTFLLINSFVNTTAAQAGIAVILLVLGFLIGLAAYFVSGIMAAKQTGKVSTGTIAGLWTGATYGVIDFIVSMILFFTVNLPRALQTNSALAAYNSSSPAYQSIKTAAIAGGVGFAIFGILFAIGLGAGLGALGGLIGKSTSKVVPAPPMPMYPYAGQPYPMQPYPMQQVPYPPQPAPYPNQPYPPQQAPYPNTQYPPQQPPPPYPPQQNFDPPY